MKTKREDTDALSDNLVIIDVMMTQKRDTKAERKAERVVARKADKHMRAR